MQVNTNNNSNCSKMLIHKILKNSKNNNSTSTKFKVSKENQIKIISKYNK